MSHTGEPRLETGRLILRLPTAQDLPLYDAFYAASDAPIGKYRMGRSPAEVAAIAAHDLVHWDTHGFGIFVICRKSDGALLGGAGLDTSVDFPGHELTWWLLPHEQRHGCAQEASLAIIDWAHDALYWPRVETYMRDENRGAHGLAQRLADLRGGHKDRRVTFPDGVMRDVYILSERSAA
jgi:ribosomal-protein-alanine N-acetyltransferase